ncbi:MAG: hypothetical protein J3R72DRAFT_426464 [Linnemannia gamsii]|nr:MAG: hypothetical protein J3R72DRAFT_426464 [Linnemannia gamsii]
MSNPVAQGSSGDNGGSSSKCGVQLSLPPPSQQSSSVQLSPATENGGFGQVRKDRRKLRLQNEKAGISETATKTKVTPNNSDKNTTALGIAGPGGQQKKGRGRPPKTKGSKAPPKIPRKKGRGRGRPPKIQNVLI